MPEIIKIGFWISVFLILIFLYRKKDLKPTKLSLDGFKNSQDGKIKLKGVRKVQAEVVHGDQSSFTGDTFVYQGKKYSCWKVLNIPVGADVSEAKKAFANRVKTDPSYELFYLKAYEVIKKLSLKL